MNQNNEDEIALIAEKKQIENREPSQCMRGMEEKNQIPTTEPVLLKAPQEVLDDPDFKMT